MPLYASRLCLLGSKMLNVEWTHFKWIFLDNLACQDVDVKNRTDKFLGEKFTTSKKHSFEILIEDLKPVVF